MSLKARRYSNYCQWLCVCVRCIHIDYRVHNFAFNAVCMWMLYVCMWFRLKVNVFRFVRSWFAFASALYVYWTEPKKVLVAKYTHIHRDCDWINNNLCISCKETTTNSKSLVTSSTRIVQLRAFVVIVAIQKFASCTIHAKNDAVRFEEMRQW